jgi:hypothetical protein
MLNLKLSYPPICLAQQPEEGFLLAVMKTNKMPEIVAPDFSTQSQFFILTLLRELAKDKTLEKYVPFESLPERYQVSAAVLWDCLLALKIEPQKINGQIYFTAQNLKRLEQLIKRIEISWACHHVLGTCRETENKHPTKQKRSSQNSSFGRSERTV